jgi:hypothetical protein
MAAALLAVNAVIGVIGALPNARRADAAVRRPVWLPPRWVRAAIPLAVAAGLWFRQPWAWWAAVAISAGMLAWTAIACSMLALGGFFSTRSPWRLAYVAALAVTWIGVLVLLLL